MPASSSIFLHSFSITNPLPFGAGINSIITLPHFPLTLNGIECASLHPHSQLPHPLFIMIMFNPTVAIQVGFQLSFLATAGIILFQEKIRKIFRFLPKPFNEDLATTVSAQSLVIPVLFYHFGSVSAISPVVNAAILWTIPLATILGFIYLAISFVVPFLAIILSWILWALLSIFVFAIELFGKLSFAYFEFESNQLLPLVLYYLVLFFAVFYFKYGGMASAKQKKN